MRFWLWLRVSSAEKKLPIPAFIVYAFIALLICFGVWFGSMKLSKGIEDKYQHMNKQVQEMMNYAK